MLALLVALWNASASSAQEAWADPPAETVSTGRIALFDVYSPVDLAHLHYTWTEYDVPTGKYRVASNRSHAWEATHTNPGERRYSVRVWYRTTDDTVIG